MMMGIAGVWQSVKPMLRQVNNISCEWATHDVLYLKSQPVITELMRTVSFLNKATAEDMWKSVITVSNAGKKKGRARGTPQKNPLDLNRRFKIGVGPANMQWPGLNAPIIQSSFVNKISKLPDPDSEESLDAPKLPSKRMRRTLHPLQRGWSGSSPLGRSLGPPPSTAEDNFKNFDSVVLELRIYSKLSGLLGRVKRSSAVVATGNKNGIIGVAKSDGKDIALSMGGALRKAATKLNYYPLIESHTVNHDFYYCFGKTRVFVHKKPKGYGLVCHRVIQELCKLIGITDLYAKVEGSINVKHIIKAFLLGLLEQKTYQEIANEKKLHVVEFRKDRDCIPIVKASPQKVLTPEEKRQEIITDFYEYLYGGKVILRKPPPPMENSPTYLKHLKRTLPERDHPEVKIRLYAEYGAIKSFLHDVYPECIQTNSASKQTPDVEN